MSNRASYQNLKGLSFKPKVKKTVILNQTPTKRVFPSIPSTPVPIKPKPQGRAILKLKI